MSHRFFLRWIGPGSLGGAHLGLWLKLLCENRGAIAPRYWGRAAMITGVAAANSLAGAVEQICFGRACSRAAIQPPLFILGAWRSDTTHLLNLLCQDQRFAFATTYEVLNPSTFLLTERIWAPIHGRFYPKTRPFDNLKMGVAEPWEDEFAVCATTGLSPLLSWVFPQNCRHYDRYIDFAGVPAEVVDRWKRALIDFVRKLSWKHEKLLVLKSPSHTARVRLLLEVFPDARFVLIHRHPYELYSSIVHQVRMAVPFVSLQRFDTEDLCRGMIEKYKLLSEAYLEQKSLIPPGRLVEIGFADLERSPMATLRHVYDSLELPSFEAAEPGVQRYLSQLGEYQKNVYPQLDAAIKALVAREWRRSFDAWGYAE